MQPLPWFERKFTFGLVAAMMPYQLERLEGTIYRIEQKVMNRSDEQLTFRMENKWSVKENIGHLCEVDEISGRRVGEILTRQAIMSRADIQNSGNYNDTDIRMLIERFASGRRANIARMAGLSDDELAMTTLHPRLQVPMSVVDLAWFDAEHDDHHLVRINIILKH